MNQYRKCNHCGAVIDSTFTQCPNCGAQLGAPGPQPGSTTPPPYGGMNNGQKQYDNGWMPGGNISTGGFSQQFLQNDAFAVSPQGSSRGVTAILALLFGSLGIHYFYCGRKTAGLIMLLVSLLSCGILASITALLSLAQGVYMFTIDNMQFYNKYVNTDETFPLF